MFGRKFRNRLIDPVPNFMLFQFYMGKRDRRRGSSGARFHVGWRNPVVELCLAMNPFPAKRIDRHIGHDPIEPGIKRRLSLETVNRSPSFQEPFLSEIPRVLLVLDHAVHHDKNLVPVTDDQLVKGVGISSLTSLHQYTVVWLK